MTLLDRYFFKQFSVYFMVAVIGFGLMAAVDILFYLTELAVAVKAPMLLTLRLLLYKLPAVMVIFFPMAVLFSIMLMLFRMAKDSELTILRASGVSQIRMMTPLLLIGLAVSVLSFAVNDRVVPHANKAFNRSLDYYFHKGSSIPLVQQIVFKSADRFFYINTVRSDSKRLERVLIFEPFSAYPRITTAEEVYAQGKVWTLKNGWTYEISSEGNLTMSHHYKEATVQVENGLSEFYASSDSPKDLSSGDLRQKISKINLGKGDARGLLVEYYLKFSLPIACLIFAILGLSLSLTFVQTGRDLWGIIVAVVLSFASVGFYFFLVAFLRAIAKDGGLTPLIGIWLPNLIYLGFGGILLMVRAIKE